MWVLEESYGKIEGKIENLSGSSVFYKFVFYDNEVVSYKNPDDGNLYIKSINEMCPDSKLKNKVLNYKSQLCNDDQVKKYYLSKIN